VSPIAGRTDRRWARRLSGVRPSTARRGSRWRIATDVANFEAWRRSLPGSIPGRALLLSTEEDRHLFVLNLDQLVSDAWSATWWWTTSSAGEGAGVFGEPGAYAEVWRERETGSPAVKAPRPSAVSSRVADARDAGRCRSIRIRTGGARGRRGAVSPPVDEAVTEALRGRGA